VKNCDGVLKWVGGRFSGVRRGEGDRGTGTGTCPFSSPILSVNLGPGTGGGGAKLLISLALFCMRINKLVQ